MPKVACIGWPLCRHTTHKEHAMKTMQRTTIAAAAALTLLGVGAGAQALSWPAWLRGGSEPTHTVAAADAPAEARAAVTPARVDPLPPGSVPNYRAIVQSAGPAVVGVTVSGLHNVNEGDDEGATAATPFDNDPFFRFFRGVPGFRMPPQGPSPFRGQGS